MQNIGMTISVYVPTPIIYSVIENIRIRVFQFKVCYLSSFLLLQH